MDQILGQILRQAVWERLDMLDDLAAQADDSSLESVARTELPRLTSGLRALLVTHEPDSKGRCPTCSRRRRPLGPRQGSCSIWRAAQQHFLPGPPPGEDRPESDSRTTRMQVAVTL